MNAFVIPYVVPPVCCVTFLIYIFDPRPELCAQTCVYLASGKASELRGKYINAESDIDSVVKQAEIVKKEGLYDLGIWELGSRRTTAKF